MFGCDCGKSFTPVQMSNMNVGCIVEVIFGKEEILPTHPILAPIKPNNMKQFFCY